MFGRDISYIWFIYVMLFVVECIGDIFDGFVVGGVEFIGFDEVMLDLINSWLVFLIMY